MNCDKKDPNDRKRLLKKAFYLFIECNNTARSVFIAKQSHFRTNIDNIFVLKRDISYYFKPSRTAFVYAVSWISLWFVQYISMSLHKQRIFHINNMPQKPSKTTNTQFSKEIAEIGRSKEINTFNVG